MLLVESSLKCQNELLFDVPVTHSGRKVVNRCFHMHIKEGGYNVRFTGDQILHGSCGGREGRLSYNLLKELVHTLSFIQASTKFFTCKSPPTF